MGYSAWRASASVGGDSRIVLQQFGEDNWGLRRAIDRMRPDAERDIVATVGSYASGPAAAPNVVVQARRV